MNNEDTINDILKYLQTPRDWNDIEDKERASILTLSFIGQVARPKNIPKNVLEKAINAFNNNRGKIETEILAVDNAIFEKE